MFSTPSLSFLSLLLHLLSPERALDNICQSHVARRAKLVHHIAGVGGNGKGSAPSVEVSLRIVDNRFRANDLFCSKAACGHGQLAAAADLLQCDRLIWPQGNRVWFLRIHAHSGRLLKRVSCWLKLLQRLLLFLQRLLLPLFLLLLNHILFWRRIWIVAGLQGALAL